MQARFTKWWGKLQDLLSRPSTSTELRHLAMQQVGGNLAWYRLFDRKTGCSYDSGKLLQTLKAFLGDSPECKGPIARLSALFSSKRAAPAPVMFDLLYEAMARQDRQHGKVPETLDGDDLAKLRLAVARRHRDVLSRTPYAHLVFYRQNGETRDSKMEIRAAFRALTFTHPHHRPHPSRRPRRR